jgi:hypothetical protein
MGGTAYTICAAVSTEFPERLTATKIRHRTSTIIEPLKLPQYTKEKLYTHMGHSADINRNVYQAPPALERPRTVGKQLHLLDQGKDSVCYQR